MQRVLFTMLVFGLTWCSAAESYRPLGIGLGDSVYSPSWATTIEGLRARNYTDTSDKTFLRITSADQYADFQRAHIIHGANTMLAKRGLKPLQMPNGYNASQFARDNGLARDEQALVYSTAPENSNDHLGRKELTVRHRISDGVVFFIMASVPVALDGPNQSDPHAIGIAMCDGLTSTCAGPYTITTGQQKREVKDAQDALLALKTSLLALPGGDALTIEPTVFSRPTWGRVTVTPNYGKYVRLTIDMLSNELQPTDQSSRESSRRFFRDMKAMADEEAKRQAATVKPTGSTEGF